MIGPSMTRNSLTLGFFAIITTASIAATYIATKDIIVEQKRKAEQAALIEIMPRSRHDNIMIDDTITVNDIQYLHLDGEKQIYVAKLKNKVVGFIFPAIAPEAYTGKISLIVGINVDGSIAGVRILSHRETPGLGDKVDLNKSDWVLGFNAKSLSNPQSGLWKVKKDKGYFDQFTGATITPRAVTKAVYQTLVYYDRYRDELLENTNQSLLNR